MKAPLVHLWIRTNLRAVAGSKRVADVKDVLGESMTKRRRGDGRLEWTMPLTDPSAAEVLDDRVAELEFEDGTIEEWRIAQRGRSVSADGNTYRVVCNPILLDLGSASPLVEYDSLGIPSFQGSRYKISATDLIDDVILPALAADGLTHWVRGTVDPTALRDYEWQDTRPLGLLHQAEEKTGAELEVEVTATQCKIHLRTQIGSSAPVADVRQARNIRSLAIEEDATERLSDCFGIGAADPGGRAAVIGRGLWRVSAVNYTTDRLTLEDPEGGPGPILEDDQLNGLYVYVHQSPWQNGTTNLILDTIGQDVQIADAGLFIVGDLVEIRKSAGTGTFKDDAQLLTSLRKPSVAVKRVGSITRPDLSGERNLIRDGHILDWSGGVNTPPAGITLNAVAVPRSLQYTGVDALLGGSALSLRFKYCAMLTANASSGQPTISVGSTQGVANGMSLRVGDNVNQETLVVSSFVADTSITFTTNLANAYTTAGKSRVFESGAETLSIPYFGAGYVASTKAAWASVRAPVGGGTLCFAQAQVTIRNPHPLSTLLLTARTQTRTAYVTSKTVEQTVQLGVPIEADAGESIVITVEHFIDRFQQTPTWPLPTYWYDAAELPADHECIVDGVAVTHTDYWPTRLPHYSNANALWHAVNRALAAGSLAAATYSCSVVDLTALDRTTWPYDELLLGATVRINQADLQAVNVLARIEEMRWRSLRVPADPELVLNSRTTPLSELLEDVLGGSAGTAPPGAPDGDSGIPNTPGVLPPGGSPLPPDDTGDDPIPTTPELIPVLIPFHANADGSLTITNIPAARTALNIRGRHRFDFTRAYQAYAYAEVTTAGPTGSRLVFEYSTDDGSTWFPLDGLAGPYVLIDSTGPKYGPTMPIDPGARDEHVLLRALSSNGDGAGDPVIGHIGLVVYLTLGELAAVPSVGCPIPGGIQYEGALNSYVDYHDFFLRRANDADSTGLFFYWYPTPATPVGRPIPLYAEFDDARLFNGQRAFRSQIDQSGPAHWVGWDLYLSDGAGGSATYDDITVHLVAELESGFDVPGETSSAQGFRVMSLATDTNGGGYNEVALFIRDGNLFLEWWRTGVALVVHDLGAVAGTFDTGILRWLLRVKRASATTFDVALYTVSPCGAPNPTAVHTSTETAYNANVKLADGRMFDQSFAPADGPATAKAYWWWQFGYTDDAALYGLTP